MSDKPVIQYLTERTREIVLKFPFIFNGREIRAIRLRRLSAGELGAHVDAILAAQKEDANAPVPIFPGLTAQDGEAIDAAIISALDADDEGALSEVISDFLPARLRPVTIAPQPEEPQSPPIGEAFASSLAPSPDGALPS